MAEDGFTANKRLDDVFADRVSAVEAVQAVYGTQNWVQAAGDAATGRWTFDPEQLDSVIGKWEALLDEIKTDRHAIRLMIDNAVPPSEDDPSGRFIGAVVDGMQSLRESNASMLSYVEDFIERLSQARDAIDQSDSGNAEALQAAVRR
ncbi:hypothetical protein ABZ863_06575 [Saccharomonospora sp. NPDC046836]|uniref:hypothetical protein n=1 Tax=Saccharomonospora sp. NPDC046836 TaxID=3156921 RepID=UPI0033C26018